MFKSQGIIGLVLLSLLGGCVVGPDYVAPKQVGEVYLQQKFTPAAHATNWWLAFNDEELNRLVKLALEQNRSLAKAQANVERASAIFADADNDLLPKGTLDAGYLANKNNSISPSDNHILSRGTQLGANLTWDVDLFGKIRRATEAAAANAEQAEALWEDAKVQIISQVASSYGEFRGAQSRLKIAQQNLANLQQSREIVEARLNEGFSSDFELARIDVQFYGIKAQIPQFQGAVLNAKATLSALLGFAPGKLRLSDNQSLPQLKKPVSIVDSQNYLRFRSDVAAAERTLAASIAGIGVSTADLYPSLSVKGFLGFITNGSSLSDLSEGWSVTPNLSWPAVDLSSVKARIRAANANARFALADFEQQVFTAVNEIQLSLDEYNLSRQQQLLTEQQFKASTQAMIIARVRYEAGSGEFFDMLDAERDWLSSRDQLAQIKQLSFAKLVSIYRVFAGSLEIRVQDV